MSGILWLASYPKSGNTWLRAFLANYLADNTQAWQLEADGSYTHLEPGDATPHSAQSTLLAELCG